MYVIFFLYFIIDLSIDFGTVSHALNNETIKKEIYEAFIFRF